MKSNFKLVVLLFTLFLQFTTYAQSSPETICDDDSRIGTNHKAVGRVWLDGQSVPKGTAFIISNGKLVTAGHVVNDFQTGVVEFNVPMWPGRSAPEDTYSINTGSVVRSNNGDGDDWAVFTVNPKFGLTPIQRQGKYFNIMKTTNLQYVRVSGYGEDTDTPTNRFFQQTATGPYVGVQHDGKFITYTVDTEAKNSGSPIIDENTFNPSEQSGIVVGVHTSGYCRTFNYNGGTSFYNNDFWEATGLATDFTVDQEREGNTRLAGTPVGRWESFSFVNYVLTQDDPIPLSAENGSDEVLKGLQDLVYSPTEKYNTWDWAANQDAINHHVFEIQTGGINYKSKFKKTYSGIEIQNKLSEVNDIDTGRLKFKDPWFINTNDPTIYEDQYGFKNLGPGAIYEWVNSPFNPNISSGYYNGVFLDQQLQDGVFYSVYSAPHDIYLNETGRTHRFYFQSWDYDPGEVDFDNPNSSSSAIVFTSDNTTITANIKGTNLSDDVKAYDNNSQRKFVRTGSGDLHSV